MTSLAVLSGRPKTTAQNSALPREWPPHHKTTLPAHNLVASGGHARGRGVLPSRALRINRIQPSGIILAPVDVCTLYAVRVGWLACSCRCNPAPAHANARSCMVWKDTLTQEATFPGPRPRGLRGAAPCRRSCIPGSRQVTFLLPGHVCRADGRWS